MASSEKSQHQTDFTLQVFKERLNGHAIVMDQCIFIWIGYSKSDLLLFGHNDQCALIDGIPSPNNQVFLQSMCIKLCKVFGNKQVYFSTDIGNNETKDPKFWMRFFETLKHYFDNNKQFYHLDT